MYGAAMWRAPCPGFACVVRRNPGGARMLSRPITGSEKKGRRLPGAGIERAPREIRIAREVEIGEFPSRLCTATVAFRVTIDMRTSVKLTSRPPIQPREACVRGVSIE